MSLLCIPAPIPLNKLYHCNVICYFGSESLETAAMRHQLNQRGCKNNDSLQRAEKATKVIFGHVGLSLNLTPLLRPLMG